MKIPNKIVAVAARMEIDNSTDDVYIVFKVINEDFKRRIRGNWLDDVELKVIGKTLEEK
jgi:hypothetical protein